eukprot:g8119.t1
MLYTIMMISTDTRKEVPIAHMVIGRTEAQDIADFLDFVRKEEPDFYPELLAIDKCDMEAKDLHLFLSFCPSNTQVCSCIQLHV